MAKQENFTSDRVAKFQCEPGKKQSIFWDGKTPGLGLRVTAGGKSYIFESRLHGKTLRTTIGDIRTWSIGKAQAEATRLKSLTDQGTDPRQLRKDQAEAADIAVRREKLREITVGEAWTAYIADRSPKWGDRHLKNHNAMTCAGGDKRTRGRRPGESPVTQPGSLYSLLGMKLSDLNHEAVSAWLEPLAAKTPTQAAQTYRALRAFVAWCADHEGYKDFTHDDACTQKKVKAAVPKQKTKTDCLQREQLGVWFEAVRRIGNPVISAYLQCLLITGARREELATLRWENIDFQWRTIVIHDKVEGQRKIPLTPHVSSLLADLHVRNEQRPNVRQMKRIEDKGEKWAPSPWVFSSPKAASGRLQDPRIEHCKACDAVGIAGLTLHGLRRSFSTLSEWVECPVGVVAQIMGHKPSATAEKHYKPRAIDLLRMWHSKIETWIIQEAGLPLPADAAQPKLATTA